MSPANGLRPLAPPLLPGKGTRHPRQATLLVFDGRMPLRLNAKGSGHPPTEVKEEGWAKPSPGDMEWEGARWPWCAVSPKASRCV